MDIREHLQKWVDGQSIHNDHPDECCPDFSCCRPELLQPIEVREAFQQAFLTNNAATLDKFLMHFLAAAFAAAGSEKKVHFAVGSNDA